MSDKGSAIMAVASGAHLLLTLAVEIALLITIFTVVRRHRPQAVTLLASSVGLGLASTAASFLMSFLAGPLLMRSGGIDQYYLFLAAEQAAFALLGVLQTVLLILGLIKAVTPEEARPGTV